MITPKKLISLPCFLYKSSITPLFKCTYVGFLSQADTQLPLTIAPSMISVGYRIVGTICFASTPYT